MDRETRNILNIVARMVKDDGKKEITIDEFKAYHLGAIIFYYHTTHGVPLRRIYSIMEEIYGRKIEG